MATRRRRRVVRLITKRYSGKGVIKSGKITGRTAKSYTRKARRRFAAERRQGRFRSRTVRRSR